MRQSTDSVKNCPSTHCASHRPPEDLPYETWLRLMMDFFRKGGDIARKWQRQITPSHKADKTVVTEADLEISALAHRVFGDLKDKNHLILDEETAIDVGAPTGELFRDHPFMWVIDPIDGSSAYAAQRASYGLSVGLIYEGRPVMGGVYMPATDELFIYDGNTPLLMHRPFSTHVHTEPLAMGTSLQGHVFFDVINKRPFKTYDLHQLPADITASNAFALGLAQTAAGRVCGTIFTASLWDMVGAWPLLDAVGAKLHNIKTGEALAQITPDLLDQNWGFKDAFIACNPAFFDPLRQGFVRR